tara:strand:- start:217 stop:537 length:321 start_codon:yes stop_codon:yes gene_type:complete
MANTYNWRINALDAKIHEGDNDNVIYTVHWSFIATDETGDFTASSIGTMGVEYDPDNFIPYADLVKSDVVGWLEAGLNVDSLKESLDNQIESKINPVDETLRPDWD